MHFIPSPRLECRRYAPYNQMENTWMEAEEAFMSDFNYTGPGQVPALPDDRRGIEMAVCSTSRFFYMCFRSMCFLFFGFNEIFAWHLGNSIALSRRRHDIRLPLERSPSRKRHTFNADMGNTRSCADAIFSSHSGSGICRQRRRFDLDRDFVHMLGCCMGQMVFCDFNCTWHAVSS